MTPLFRKACEHGQATCNEHRTSVEFLEEMAKLHPEWSDRIAELRSKLDHIDQLSEGGLMLMDSMSK